MGFIFHEAPGLADLVRIQTSKVLYMSVTCVSDVGSLFWTEGLCYLYLDFRSPGSSCRNPYSSLLRWTPTMTTVWYKASGRANMAVALAHWTGVAMWSSYRSGSRESTSQSNIVSAGPSLVLRAPVWKERLLNSRHTHLKFAWVYIDLHMV